MLYNKSFPLPHFKIQFLVDSNDSLYAGEKKFTSEVIGIVHKLLGLISDHIKTLTSTDDVKKR